MVVLGGVVSVGLLGVWLFGLCLPGLLVELEGWRVLWLFLIVVFICVELFGRIVS